MMTITTTLLVGIILISTTTVLPNVHAAPNYSHARPPPQLSASDNQAIINVALSVPGLQSWSHDWKYVTEGFGGNNKPDPYFQWQYVMVTLRAPSGSAPVACDIDWWANVEVDMTTMKVVSATYPTTESHICHGVELGGPAANNQDSNSTKTYYIPAKIRSPLQQSLHGIASKDVICKQGLQLILKAEDGSPACVTPDTSKILIERGWARTSQ